MIEHKNFIALAVIGFLTGVAIGHYTVPTKTVTVKETVEVEKKKADVNTDDKLNKHTEITKTETIGKDGSKTTTIKKTEDINNDKKSDTKTSLDEAKIETDKKEVVKESGHLNLAGLAMTDVHNLSSGLTFGAQVSRNILGPITLGAFGFTNGQCGVSLGLQF